MSAVPPNPAVQTVRLTVSQAVVRFLQAQFSERDGVRRPFFGGVFGIFGHGNVAGVGQALLEAEEGALGDGWTPPARVPYMTGRNEQAMVHAAVGFARQQDRLQTLAVTASVGPGSSNMLTGAALATINRIPVLLLPSDVFATRVASPVLQELEQPYGYDVSVNDAFRPLSKFFDRVWRPEQLPSALLGAMRVLTDPAETGAATICLPEDLQAEAWEFPVELFRERTWRIARPVPEQVALDEAAALIRTAKAPLVVAGGGVVYSQATEALKTFVEATGIPVGQSQAGKGAIRYDHPLSLGAIGSTGTTAANEIAAEADVVIGVGTRYSDFTTASRTVFQNPDVKFVNVNVAAIDAVKHAGIPVQADAKAALEALTAALADFSTPDAYRERAARLNREWDEVVDSFFHSGIGERTGLLAQAEVIGAVDEVAEDRDVVVCAAGSLPGDLHCMWRSRDPKQYHVEYGYSCMGYEIPGGIGVALAAPDRDVFITVGDGSYLMMPTELVTAVQEGVKVIVVLLQNHGFASIGALSEQHGSQRYGTKYRRRTAEGRLEGDKLPVDLAANAESLGVRTVRVGTRKELVEALREAKASSESSVVHVETDLYSEAPDGGGWWDVPVSEVSHLESTRTARTWYEGKKQAQRPLL
ncbi:3D-(3,5/4)-trihydroxycyclohexane-1,2-dione acylhydrolase (decyclizing) [Kineococcus sp. NPDC059986]|jgi:3D-(3,5/4)-trihydroxycyclohexane-1,2-dione acylhydrolase (decyclizing)|uniref:3D-(3,5/4)-trihydroxycyclohexane-1,2-dione acylhydrolase (decyclizing) n=1 Tax=Kineococcus sp. NPDC059986 TaxID=3155538 RepID=UPI00344E2E45